MRLCVSAGEPLPPPILERFQARFGVEVLDGIGTTEALHIFISNRPGEVRAGSTGRVVPGYEARIAGPGGRDAAPGEVGDLLVKGDSIAAGYFGRPRDTERTFLGEWLATGDRFHKDEEGLYWFHGRSDDLLKVQGLWVSPAEVEAALLEHPSVLECAVVGREDSSGLTRPQACVVLKGAGEGSRDLAAEMEAHLRVRLASHKRPRWIRFLPALPRTPTGKVERYKLRALEGRPGAGEPA